MIRLLGKSECPLCDVAEALLTEAGVAYEKVDITVETRWYGPYWDKIPVLIDSQERALCWPFDCQQIRRFCDGTSASD